MSDRIASLRFGRVVAVPSGDQPVGTDIPPGDKENPMSTDKRRLPGGGVRPLARLAITLFGWAAAFLIVTTILASFGPQLNSLPLPLRALTISGVLVVLMTNVVTPGLGWLFSALTLRLAEATR